MWFQLTVCHHQQPLSLRRASSKLISPLLRMALKITLHQINDIWCYLNWIVWYVLWVVVTVICLSLCSFFTVMEWWIAITYVQLRLTEKKIRKVKSINNVIAIEARCIYSNVKILLNLTLNFTWLWCCCTIFIDLQFKWILDWFKFRFYSQKHEI